MCKIFPPLQNFSIGPLPPTTSELPWVAFCFFLACKVPVQFIACRTVLATPSHIIYYWFYASFRFSLFTGPCLFCFNFHFLPGLPHRVAFLWPKHYSFLWWVHNMITARPCSQMEFTCNTLRGRSKTNDVCENPWSFSNSTGEHSLTSIAVSRDLPVASILRPTDFTPILLGLHWFASTVF